MVWRASRNPKQDRRPLRETELWLRQRFAHVMAMPGLGESNFMKLSKKARKGIKRCAEDARIILDEDIKYHYPYMKFSLMNALDKIYGLMVKIEILLEGKNGKRRLKRGSKKTGG